MWALDVGLAGFCTVAAVLLYLEVVTDRGEAVSALALAVAVVHGGSILFRRRFPLAVMVVLLITATGYVALGFPAFMLGPAILIAVYTVAALLDRGRSLLVLAATEAALVGLLVAGSAFPGWESVFLYALIVAAAWFLGDVVRRWRTAAEEHARRAAELTAAREELARYAVGEERLRIARELHDVVAHSMTVVAMHAGTARMIGDRDPAAAQAALETIERSSREALGEMRRVVGVLREGDADGVSLQPTPGLRDLERLVAEVGAAGVEVELRTEGALDEVPAGPALAAFRIAQEALTNVVKHSGSAHADLAVTVAEGEVAIAVCNDPPAKGMPGPSVEGAGMGTIGMRERVSLYGGTLTVGPLGDGGFLVEARLPLGIAEP